MARSTFEGPILSGDQRFGSQRDVGYTDLFQQAFLDFSNTTPGTTNYGGSSGVFVSSNNIPNNTATIWTPQAGVYSNTGPTIASAPTADTSGTIYRGVVFLIPQNSNIFSLDMDVGILPAGGGVTATGIQAYVSNNFLTTGSGVYATMANATAAGRTTSTFTATQLDNAWGTLQDVQNIQPGQQPAWFSQVVVTLKITATSLTTLTAGQIALSLRYVQTDQNIGNATTYPYGNFD